MARTIIRRMHPILCFSEMLVDIGPTTERPLGLGGYYYNHYAVLSGEGTELDGEGSTLILCSARSLAPVVA